MGGGKSGVAGAHVAHGYAGDGGEVGREEGLDGGVGGCCAAPEGEEEDCRGGGGCRLGRGGRVDFGAYVGGEIAGAWFCGRRGGGGEG